AVKATTPAQATIAFPASYQHATDGVESAAIVSQAVTVRGGYVLALVQPSLFVTSSGTSWILLLILKRDGTIIASRRCDYVGPANVYLPVGGFDMLDSGAAAGTRTYTVHVTFYGAGTNVQITANNTGALSVVESG